MLEYPAKKLVMFNKKVLGDTMDKDIKEEMYKTKDYFEFDDFLDTYFSQYKKSPFKDWNKEVKNYFLHDILKMTEEALQEM